MRKKTAAILGFFAAPVVPAVFCAIGTDLYRDEDILSKLPLVPFFYMFSLSASFFLGLPAFLLGRHLHFIRWWTALVTGSAIGAIVVILIRQQSRLNAQDFAIYCPLGAVSAITFWLIWRCGQEGGNCEEKSDRNCEKL